MKDSLETQTQPAVIYVFVENQAILKPILLYRAWKYKENWRLGRRTVYEPTFITFLWGKYKYFLYIGQTVDMSGSNWAIIACDLS